MIRWAGEQSTTFQVSYARYAIFAGELGPTASPNCESEMNENNK